mmetsp:Transcript_75813/g.209189  ORF Transcript_75813/g.209189 Transcript_75813/m.209189 type:complete len:260 (+) Transcript_75813:151-930(+)
MRPHPSRRRVRVPARSHSVAHEIIQDHPQAVVGRRSALFAESAAKDALAANRLQLPRAILPRVELRRGRQRLLLQRRRVHALQHRRRRREPIVQLALRPLLPPLSRGEVLGWRARRGARIARGAPPANRVCTGGGGAGAEEGGGGGTPAREGRATAVARTHRGDRWARGQARQGGGVPRGGARRAKRGLGHEGVDGARFGQLVRVRDGWGRRPLPRAAYAVDGGGLDDSGGGRAGVAQVELRAREHLRGELLRLVGVEG